MYAVLQSYGISCTMNLLLVIIILIVFILNTKQHNIRNCFFWFPYFCFLFAINLRTEKNKR